MEIDLHKLHKPPAKKLAYHHAYHQSLVYKIFNASKSRGIINNLDQSLDLIQRTHRISRGLPQIVYLVGWQYAGHDSKYPAWHECNEGLRRRGDASARDSILWLMREARQYNTTVSVHVNMDDAYMNSPLWDEYVAAGLIQKTETGELQKGGIWGGEQCYLISKTREWRTGHARKRLDALLRLLPIQEAGTLHIDVFSPRADPTGGITLEDDVQTMKEILLYLHSKGVDVTKEWFDHELAGYVPMAYHFQLDEVSRLRYPPEIACGGGDAWNKNHNRGHIRTPEWMTPEDGCLCEEAWGRSIDGDYDADNFDKIAQEFFLKTVPWLFLNRRQAQEYRHTRETFEVEFSDEVRSQVRFKENHLRITHHGHLLVDGKDLCVPAEWRERELLAYSHDGGTKTWKMPVSWKKVDKLRVETLLPVKQARTWKVPVAKGFFSLKLPAKHAVVISPA
jgi:hypothetical protein